MLKLCAITRDALIPPVMNLLRLTIPNQSINQSILTLQNHTFSLELLGHRDGHFDLLSSRRVIAHGSLCPKGVLYISHIVHSQCQCIPNHSRLSVCVCVRLCIHVCVCVHYCVRIITYISMCVCVWAIPTHGVCMCVMCLFVYASVCLGVRERERARKTELKLCTLRRLTFIFR